MVLRTAVKRAVNAVLRPTGVEIRARQPEIVRPTFQGVLENCVRLGLAPPTVFDIGVGTGTFELYDAFPDAHHVLIEPLHEFEGVLRRISEVYDAEYVLAAAADAEGTMTINVHTDNLDSSSILCEVEGKEVDGVPRGVPVTTVDSLVRTRGLHGPFVLKVDVQGSELAVMRGSHETLGQAELVMLEVSLFGVFHGGPQLCEVLQYMKERGFVAYDVYGAAYRPLDGALWQLDVAFVKEGGMFRRSHAYATVEQRCRLNQDFVRSAAKVEAKLAAQRRK